MKKILTLSILMLAVTLSSCASGDGSNPTAGETTARTTQAETTAPAETTARAETTVAPAETTAVQTETTAAPAETAPISLDSNASLKDARERIFESMRQEAMLDETRSAELDGLSMTFGEATMNYTLATIGEEGEDGYPVYIALHGGGGTTKDVNDDQWRQMQTYYRFSVKSGIYIAPRGVRDTWDTHFNPESYPLYERLLENLSIYYNIDTNRVYLLGYSAGGDGVYQISPRLADRFAAVNMSAGHPNGVNLANLYNTPISLQCGEKDSSYDRNLETAKYDSVLTDLSVLYGRNGQPEGYEHRVFLHLGKGHAVKDNDVRRTEQTVLTDLAGWLENGQSETENTNTNAVDFVSAYTRNPLPERIVWDLSVRAEQSDTETFYWLRAPKDVTEGVVVASYDPETNTVHIEQNTANGPVYAMVNDEMLDIFQDINVTTADGQTRAVTVTPTVDYIQKTIEERWDKNMIFVGEFELPACGGSEQ